MYIFYCVGGKFDEVTGGRSARKHQTLNLASGVLSVLSSAGVKQRTHCTGCRVFLVGASGAA